MTGTLRDLRPNELKSVYARVKRDFPPIEHPPLCSMRRYLAKGSLHGSIYETDGADAGYAYVLIGGKAVGKFPVVYGATIEQTVTEKKPFWKKLLHLES